MGVVKLGSHLTIGAYLHIYRTTTSKIFIAYTVKIFSVAGDILLSTIEDFITINNLRSSEYFFLTSNKEFPVVQKSRVIEADEK